MNLETRAEKYIESHSNGESFFTVGKNFPFDFALCLKEVAESGNKELFRKLIDSYVSYSEKVNQKELDKELIKIEALDFIEFQCMVGDTGRMTIGIPGMYSSGPTRKMFLDIYSGQLARDIGYTVTHSINL